MVSRQRPFAFAIALPLLVLALVAPPAAGQATGEAEEAPAGSPLTIQAAVGAEVVDRELRGVAETFPEGGRVYFFTRVSGARPGSRLLHVWYREGEEKATVELEIGAESWRTWSYKTMHPGSKGAWKVEAVDTEGRTLATVKFTCE